MKFPCVICDIDGTVAIRGDRGPYDMSLVIEDSPRANMDKILQALDTFFYLVYVSGRQEQARASTEYWLRTHNFPQGHRLFMRTDGDNRKDFIIKKEILESKILPTYRVIAVLDDRDQVVDMWRDQGLLCLQVDRGDF